MVQYQHPCLSVTLTGLGVHPATQGNFLFLDQPLSFQIFVLKHRSVDVYRLSDEARLVSMKHTHTEGEIQETANEDTSNRKHAVPPGKRRRRSCGS